MEELVMCDGSFVCTTKEHGECPHMWTHYAKHVEEDGCTREACGIHDPEGRSMGFKCVPWSVKMELALPRSWEEVDYESHSV